jgi:hypothetical protein
MNPHISAEFGTTSQWSASKAFHPSRFVALTGKLEVTSISESSGFIISALLKATHSSIGTHPLIPTSVIPVIAIFKSTSDVRISQSLHPSSRFDPTKLERMENMKFLQQSKRRVMLHAVLCWGFLEISCHHFDKIQLIF